MKPFDIKDKILQQTYAHPTGVDSEWLSDQLHIPHHTIYTLCIEMVTSHQHLKLLSRHWLTNQETSCFVQIRPEGKHFHDTTSYQKEEKKAKGDWTKRHPLLYDIVKGVILLLLGYVIRFATEPTNNHTTNKATTAGTTGTATKKQ